MSITLDRTTARDLVQQYADGLGFGHRRKHIDAITDAVVAQPRRIETTLQTYVNTHGLNVQVSTDDVVVLTALLREKVVTSTPTPAAAPSTPATPAFDKAQAADTIRALIQRNHSTGRNLAHTPVYNEQDVDALLVLAGLA